MSESGVGINNAIVTLEPLRLVEFTDQSGAYAFPAVAAGAYDVVINIGELEAREQGVLVRPGETITVTKLMPRDFRVVMTTTVDAASRAREQRLEVPAAVSVVPEKTIALEGGAGQLPSLLGGMAGAEYTQSGVYDIQFNARGFNGTLSRRVQVLLDGRNLAAPENKNQEWISVGFLTSEIESIEFIRGPAAALYGANSINGVVALTTKSPRGSPGGRVRATTGELGTFIGDVRWAGPFSNDWYGRFVVNHTRSGSFTQSRTEQVEYGNLPLEVAPALIDTQGTSADARFDKYLAGGQQLIVEGGFALTEGGTYLTQGGRISVVESNRSWSRVNLHTNRWSAHAYLNTRHADQKALFAPVQYPTASVQFKSEVQGGQSIARDKGRVVFGGSYGIDHVDSADAAGVQTLYQRAVTAKEGALFAQLDYYMSSRVKVVGGLRWDDSTLHSTQLSPKLALVYLPAAGHSLHVTFRRGFQVGNYTELFLSSPLAPPVDLSAIEAVFAPILGDTSLGFAVVPVNAFGNSNLDVEKVKSIEVGYTASLGSRTRISIDAYRNTMRDFISDLTPGINPAYPAYQAPPSLPAASRAVIEQTVNALIPGLTNRPDGGPQIVYSYGNVGLVTSRGVEVEGAFRPRPEWSLEASYTRFDFTLVEAPPGLEPNPNTPKHRMAFGVTYAPGRFAASFRHRWVDRFLWASGLFVGPVPSYHVSDVNAIFSVTRRWQVGANISNVFDRRHYEMFGGDILRRRALAHLTVTW